MDLQKAGYSSFTTTKLFEGERKKREGGGLVREIDEGGRIAGAL
jgi:hypothetical protein